MTWSSILYGHILPSIVRTNILLSLLFGRALFATLALSILIMLIIFVRKNNLAPNIRSYLWMLCVPTLFIPFERSAVILRQGQVLDLYAIFQSFVSLELLPILYILPTYVWLLGFIMYAIKTHREHGKTIHLLKIGKITSCAAYYYKGRSHIYTPPNFEEAYSPKEREMLLAHEEQHIKQLDPLLFLFLQGIKCVFWFNPLVHKAVQYIRHDRELLCDERVNFNYSKIDYGMLLLSEAQKALPAYPLVGIASQPAGIYERVIACTRPFSRSKKAAITVACIAIFLFAVGSIGFIRPIVYNPMETTIAHADDLSFTHIEGFERFILLQQDGITISRDLYQYAIAEGFKTDDNLFLTVIQVRRPTMFSSSIISRGFLFTISDLNTGEIFFANYDVEFSLHSLWGMFYRIL
ncbi:MAG: hypothetical protein FWC91_01330 [Defluviitaleaceae bacterium]|nr:hypothetical protein [Defluviitaleaceae bacterium]